MEKEKPEAQPGKLTGKLRAQNVPFCMNVANPIAKRRKNTGVQTVFGV